jgi:NADPH-dependent ferric siderophore reductase
VLEGALRSLELPPGDVFVFVAGESAAIRAIRGHLAERGHPRDAQRVSAYWKQGVSAFHE